jgi:hypothetical protein
MQHLELSDEEEAALIKELDNIVERDRYPPSSRVRTLRAILAKLRPEPVREPLPPRGCVSHRELSEHEVGDGNSLTETMGW